MAPSSFWSLTAKDRWQSKLFDVGDKELICLAGEWHFAKMQPFLFSAEAERLSKMGQQSLREDELAKDLEKGSVVHFGVKVRAINPFQDFVEDIRLDRLRAQKKGCDFSPLPNGEELSQGDFQLSLLLVSLCIFRYPAGATCQGPVR